LDETGEKKKFIPPEDFRTSPSDPNYPDDNFQPRPLNQIINQNRPLNQNNSQELSNIMNKFFQTHNQVQEPRTTNDIELEEALKISKVQSEKLNRKYEKLENDLVTRGLKIYQVNDDGNCLFRALSFQLHGTVDLYSEVREKIITYMRSAKEHFDNFITEDFDAYLAKMSCDGEYGTNLEVQACVESFQRPIEVYSDEAGAEPLNIFQGDHFLQSPLRVSYHRGNHYNAVIPIENEESVIPPTSYGKFEPREKVEEKITTEEMAVCPYCNHVSQNLEDLQIHMLTTCEVGRGFI